MQGLRALCVPAEGLLPDLLRSYVYQHQLDCYPDLPLHNRINLEPSDGLVAAKRRVVNFRLVSLLVYASDPVTPTVLKPGWCI